MDECQFDKAAEVPGGLLETRENASALFEPADKSLDDVATAIRPAIKFYGSRISIFVVFGRNDWLDSQRHEGFVNPVGAISLVATQGHRPRNGNTVTIMQTLVSSVEQCLQSSRVVRLARRQMEMERMTFAIAEEMDFCGKTPARTA